jgi:hypothetical protein
MSRPAVIDLQNCIDQQVKEGAKRIVIPPGCYRVQPRSGVHLTLDGLPDGVTIDATGVEMLCLETTRALSISNCTNLTLQGLTIDYDPLPYTQGRITSISKEKVSVQLRQVFRVRLEFVMASSKYFTMKRVN